MPRFLPNPEANWGPKPKHGKMIKPREQAQHKGPTQAAAAAADGQAAEQAQQGDGQDEAEAMSRQQGEAEAEPM